jgi:membrane protein implicated in regulation of membrane protease activity
MNDTSNQIIYSIANDGFWHFQFMIGYLASIIIVSYILSQGKISKTIARIILTIVFLISAGVTIKLWLDHSKFKSIEERNECEMTYGEIEEVIITPKKSGYLQVGGKVFRISGKGVLTQGFKWSKGDLEKGQEVAICSFEGKILRIESIN